jgi:hypothetical protein
MEIKVKFPDHGATIARFLAKLPPRVRAELFRSMGWRVFSNSAIISPHCGDSRKVDHIPGDKTLETLV